MTKWKEKCSCGSYSVEAAFIMPIVLFVIIGLCYMCFYMHDKIRIQSTINTTLLKLSHYVKHESKFDTGEILYKQLGERGIFHIISGLNQDDKLMMESYLKEQLKNGLFITEVESVEIHSQGFSIFVKASSYVRFPFHRVRCYIMGETQQMEVSFGLQPHNPSEFVWGYTALNEVLSETKGYDTIKDKLSKLMNCIR